MFQDNLPEKIKISEIFKNEIAISYSKKNNNNKAKHGKDPDFAIQIPELENERNNY